jgi:hypothetical protein
MSESRTLVVTCGLPGVGKTTVAEAVADRLDAALHRTDVVRKELLSEPQYTEAETRRVYDELFDRGQAAVESGRDVVLDGTFFRADFRERARRTAETADAEVRFRLVKVECAESVVRERIRARTDDESDADFEVYTMHKDTFEPVEVPHVTVDNSEGVAATRRQVSEHF